MLADASQTKSVDEEEEEVSHRKAPKNIQACLQKLICDTGGDCNAEAKPDSSTRVDASRKQHERAVTRRLEAKQKRSHSQFVEIRPEEVGAEE